VSIADPPSTASSISSTTWSPPAIPSVDEADLDETVSDKTVSETTVSETTVSETTVSDETVTDTVVPHASFSFADALDDRLSGASGAAVVAYADFVSISDETGQITVEVPAVWDDISIIINNEFGPSIVASTDIAGFLGGWENPGLLVEASSFFDPGDLETVIAEADFAAFCVAEDLQPYVSAEHTGLYRVWTDCGGVGAVLVSAVVTPTSDDLLIRLLVQALETRDLDAADRLLASFAGDVS
jgi:hypothetical protein